MKSEFDCKLCLQTIATLLESLCKRQEFSVTYRRRKSTGWKVMLNTIAARLQSNLGR
jgi:hypothetical protein